MSDMTAASDRTPGPRTIVNKILDEHVITEDGGRSLVYLDRLILADTALGAMRTLEGEGRSVRRPQQTLLVTDHYAASTPLGEPTADPRLEVLIRTTEDTARNAGIDVIGMGDPKRGIQHIVSVEQGYALPGVTVAAVDSHTSTQGAVGALAFSIGSDLPHALATQCVWVKRPAMMRISLEGNLARGVTAKDVALALMAAVGANGALGHAIEYAGSFVRALAIEGRMTLCNMTAEMGGLIGIVAPDQTTVDYLRGRPFAPVDEDWKQACAAWASLPTDPDAAFDREVTLDVAAVEPMVTWGNSPQDVLPISGVVPDPASTADTGRRATMEAALEYMDLQPGMPMAELAIDQVFIGSCTNAQMGDLRAAASIIRGRKVAIPTWVVPGSGPVKAQAEQEGLHTVFLQAGAEWREPGCSMCVSMNGDRVAPGMRCASTSNRNHMGRQGPGSRTHLLSPPMAAAAALTGRLTDVRKFPDA